MAPTFTHGKSWQVLADGFNLGRILTDASQSFSADTAACSVFGDTDHAFQAGHRNGTISLNGYGDASTATAEIRDTYGQALGSTAARVITYGQAAAQGRVRLMSGVLTQADISAPSADMVKATLAAQSDRGPRTGWLLRALAQRTSTGSATAFDWKGAASTVSNEIFAHLHVTATSQVTTAVIKVQHSSNGTAWTDLLTFSNSTGQRGERKSVTATLLKRYVRETLAAGFAGTSPKITYAVSMSRPFEAPS
jgi:hypothetical protein